MVKLTMIKPPIPLDRLLERVNRLEAKFGEREVLKPETLPEKRDKAGPSPSSDLPSPPAPAGLPPDAPAGQPPEKSEEPPTAGSSEPAAAGGNPELDEVLSSWNSIVNYIRPKRMSVATYLQEGYPLRLENNTVFIGFPEELKFHKETLESAENRRLIEEAIGQALKVNLRVALTLVEPVKFQNHVPRTGLPRAEKDDEAAVPPGAGQKKAEEGPLIKTAIELLGGEIIKGNSGNGRAS
jgi:hypothetical protein